MSIQPIAYLKSRFVCKSHPTQKDFIDLIDTLAALPAPIDSFCGKNIQFDTISACTTGINVETSMYITSALNAAEAYFTNLSAINANISNLSVNDIAGSTAYFTSLTSLSTIVNVIDIKIYEVSGFQVNGNVDITGEVTVGGPLSAESIVTDCGTSEQWCSTYTLVCANSATWSLGDSAVNALVHNTSGNWNSVYSTTCANSGNWGSTYTTVCASSASWSNAYVLVSGADFVYADGIGVKYSPTSYTAATTSISGHFSGINTKLATLTLSTLSSVQLTGTGTYVGTVTATGRYLTISIFGSALAIPLYRYF